MILLKGITCEESRVDMLIADGRIACIGLEGAAMDWALAGNVDMVDCRGKVAIPGFVNMHTHAGMSLMRGIGEDMVFADWIRRIWEVEKHIDEEFVYWSTKVACIEMIRTGTTTFNDQYWHFQAGHQAAVDMGIRVATGYDLIDHGLAEEGLRQQELCTRWYEEEAPKWTDGSRYQIAFHAIYSVSEPTMLWAADFARKHNLNLHIHLCETRKEVEDCRAAHGGLTPVEYLDRLGILGPNLIAAHTLWLTDNDIRLLSEAGVHCVHNINSNAKISSGYRFLYDEMRDAGINICLGTDGCASSNNLDMLEVMKTSALFQKAWRDNPRAMPLDELLQMASLNGARALRLDTGRLEAGALADLCIIDTDNSFFLSPAPFLANLVYSAHSDCIDSVICNGRFVMRHREIEGEAQTLAEARKLLARIA